MFGSSPLCGRALDQVTDLGVDGGDLVVPGDEVVEVVGGSWRRSRPISSRGRRRSQPWPLCSPFALTLHPRGGQRYFERDNPSRATPRIGGASGSGPFTSHTPNERAAGSRAPRPGTSAQGWPPRALRASNTSRRFSALPPTSCNAPRTVTQLASDIKRPQVRPAEREPPRLCRHGRAGAIPRSPRRL